VNKCAIAEVKTATRIGIETINERDLQVEVQVVVLPAVEHHQIDAKNWSRRTPKTIVLLQFVVALTAAAMTVTTIAEAITIVEMIEDTMIAMPNVVYKILFRLLAVDKLPLRLRVADRILLLAVDNTAMIPLQEEDVTVAADQMTVIAIRDDAITQIAINF